MNNEKISLNKAQLADSKFWTVKHDAEGNTVIAHDDYGNVPAWNRDIALTVANYLNDGPSAVLNKLRKVDDYRPEFGEVLIVGKDITGSEFKHVAWRDTSGAEPYWKYKTSLSGYSTVEENQITGFQLIDIGETS